MLRVVGHVLEMRQFVYRDGDSLSGPQVAPQTLEAVHTPAFTKCI